MNDTKWWVTNALGVFLLLYLLGAFEPVLGTPLVRELRRHDEKTDQVLVLLRGICRGVWREFRVADQECGK
jgi:hypothetical protein